jgi:N-acetylglucosamine malate deacetylase 1
MKLDILLIMAHPDDAELSCGGTIIKHTELGYKVGIIDLTEGELGTRGTAVIRRQEAKNASKILGVSVRENLKFRDGWFEDDEEHRLKIVQKIRQYQPSTIITNAPDDRHPDHIRASKMVKESAWLSGLKKVETKDDSGNLQPNWRPQHVYYVIQYNALIPDFIIDISGYETKKMDAILAYESQFYNPAAESSNTLISQPEFLELLKAKMLTMGNYAHITNGEGFISDYKPAVKHLFDLL